MDTPVLTRDQVRMLDRRAIADYGMSGLVLMENAGRGVVDVLSRLGADGPVVVCCGTGNNAGDGFVIARHLDLRGTPVKVLLASPPARLRGDAAVNLKIMQKSEIRAVEFSSADGADQLAAEFAGAQWIVDALLGTGARGTPRPPLDVVIAAMNAAQANKLAVDLPSGLDCDTGEIAEPTFRADHTCSFVAAKPGLLARAAEPYVGQLHIVDIGAPRKLLEETFRRPSTS
jgi:NAD(P)H-hydrate epimerase